MAGPATGSRGTAWRSAPFATAGWRQVTVLVRARSVRNGRTVTTPALGLEVRNHPDMPFASAAGDATGAGVVSAEARAVWTSSTRDLEVVSFSVYRSR